MRITVHRTSRDAADPLAEDIAARVEAGDLRVLGVATGLHPAAALRGARAPQEPWALRPHAVRARRVRRPAGRASGELSRRRRTRGGAAAGDRSVAGARPRRRCSGGVRGRHRGARRNRPADRGDRRQRPHRLQRAGIVVRIAYAPLVSLDDSTRRANARFFSSIDEVPRSAVTQGIGTILRARRIVALAFGEAKAAIVAEAISGAPDRAGAGERAPRSPGCGVGARRRRRVAPRRRSGIRGVMPLFAA